MRRQLEESCADAKDVSESTFQAVEAGLLETEEEQYFDDVVIATPVSFFFCQLVECILQR